MHASKKYVLRYRKDDETWKEMPLNDEVSIGSSAQATLQLEGETVSPFHVRLELKPDGVWITDLGSASGTILEGRRLMPQTPVRLKGGQSFHAGGYIFTLFELVPQSMDEQQAGKVRTTSIEKLVSRSPWLRWVWEHAALVSGVVITITLVIIALIFFVMQRQSAQMAMIKINQTTSALATTSQPAETLMPGVTPPVTSTVTQTLPPFIAQTVQPTQSAAQLTVIPPGLGNIQIDPINLLSNGQVIENLWQTLLTIGSNQSVDLATTITGSNIGFIYRYAGLREIGPGGSQVFRTIEMQYLGAENNQEIGGVLIPDWGEGEIPIKFNWKPAITRVGDGTQWEDALVYPVDYNSVANVEGAAFATNGRYTYLNGNQVPSRIFFDGSGKMIAIYGYKESTGFRGTPYEIVPERGEKFTILKQQFEFKSSQQPTPPALPPVLTDLLGQATVLPFGQLVGQAGTPGYGQGDFILYEDGTLTYQGTPFRWQREENIPGDYVVGLVVEDLDGNYLIAYVPVRVK